MSYDPSRSVGAHDADAGGHMVYWFWGVVGALGVAAGLLLSSASETSEISLPFVTIDMSEVSNLVGPILLVVGGVVVAIAMLAGAWRDYSFEEGWLLVIVQGVVGLLGVAAVVLGVLAILDRTDIFTFPGLPL